MSGGEKSRVSLLRSTLLFYRRNTSPLNNQSSSSGESEASIGYTSSSHHRSSAPSLDSDRLPSQSASSGKTVRIGTSSSEKNQETREMESKPRRHVSAGRKKSRSYSPGGGNSNAPQKHDLPPSDPKNNSHVDSGFQKHSFKIKF